VRRPALSTTGTAPGANHGCSSGADLPAVQPGNASNVVGHALRDRDDVISPAVKPPDEVGNQAAARFGRRACVLGDIGVDADQHPGRSARQPLGPQRNDVGAIAASEKSERPLPAQIADKARNARQASLDAQVDHANLIRKLLDKRPPCAGQHHVHLMTAINETLRQIDDHTRHTAGRQITSKQCDPSVHPSSS
jgi:hypothetical protein